MAKQDSDDFSGMWRCTHWYPNIDDTGQDVSVHLMRAHQQGDVLVLESVPDPSESYMLVRLQINGEIAAGSWHETTQPDGDFKGAQYSGDGQLVIDRAKKTMEGLWSGAGYDRKHGKYRIYTDKWQLVFAGEKQEA